MSDPGASSPDRTRAVVTDDGATIRLTTYPAGVSEPLAVCELSVELAARLSAQLIGAVATRLERERNHRVGIRRGPAQ